jgi:four helix bundle protein
MRNLRELKIWQKGMNIVTGVYRLAASLPVDGKYGLKAQLQRAAVSIPSNIAEGCSRTSEQEFKRFSEIAIGSAYELETQLKISLNLDLIPKGTVDPILSMVSQEQKMLNSFISKVKRRKIQNSIPKTQSLNRNAVSSLQHPYP